MPDAQNQEARADDKVSVAPIPPISTPSLRSRVVWLGFLFVFVVLALVVVLFWATSGVFLAAHWVAFYVAVALITGLVFWLITGSSGDFTWKEFGIRLGGGAAIGMAFMFAANHLTPTEGPSNIRVVDLSILDVDKITTPVANGGISRVISIEGTRYLVEFAEGEFEGKLSVHYLSKDGKRRQRTYTIRRAGKLPAPQDIDEDSP